MNKLQAAEKRYANLKFLWEREQVKNADMLDALKATQDCAKMAALAVDIRMTLNPGKAVEYFNSIFPEVARAIAKAEGDND